MRVALIFVAVVAAAQTSTSSSSNSWSFDSTLRGATDVVVADIVSGSGIDNGSQVSVRATIRVVRVLQGALAPGAELAISWQYQPTLIEGAATTSKVPLERGLWFLDKTTPLQASVMLPMGGRYLPAGPAPRYYAPNATLGYKVAAELAPVLEDIAAHHAEDLSPRPIGPAMPAVLPDWARRRAQFQAILMTLSHIDAAAEKEIFGEFSARPEPYLKAVGLAGRLESGDASAIIDLEANLAVVGPVFAAGAMPLSVNGFDLRGNLPAARALARLAIGETAVPAVEGGAAMQLGSTRSAEFLPYLMVMLGAPAPYTRGSALMAFCPLLRDGPFWKSEMSPHCPNRAPLNDAAAEHAEIRYWTSWWDANREQIAKTTALATVHPPARYSVASAAVQPIRVPEEIQFGMLLGMTSHTPHDPVSPLLPEPDRALYREISAAANAKLDAHEKRAQEVMNAARLAGKLPDLATMRNLDQDRTAILRAGLDELRNRLSPAGRQAFEKFFAEMGGGIVGATLSGPPK